ncbi:MAG: hypothetical protein CBC48_06770 [bacterium TMED88]|nr:hypothetical protein [Deltaproteobacteria bacterium]OUV33345.1 MAG: hypothetical protein CBC48_06770 [bacterium TMED88]
MKSAAALLKVLADRDIRIRAEDERLIVDAPKGSIDEELGSEIRAVKDDLLEILREANSDSSATEPSIVAIGPQADGYISPFQERIWMLEQIRPDSGENNLPGAWRLRGPLNEMALQSALSDFIRIHPMLRARFFQDNSRVTRRENPLASIPLLQGCDFSSTPAGQRETEFQKWLEDMARVPFDLSNEPPIRMYLARLGPEEHAIYAVSHSIAWDGWCFDIMLEDLGLLYSAHCRREEPQLPQSTIRYEDFAYWQRTRGQSDRGQEDLLFWQKRLAGALKTLPIPTDRPRPQNPNHAGARSNFALNDHLVTQLSKLARNEGVTVYMILLSIWSVLIGRMIDQNDVVVTTPVRGRDQANLENVVGPFTNTLFLRIQWDPSDSFRSVIRKVKAISLEAMGHQACPVDDFLRSIPGELKESSLFQLNFSYQNTEDRLTHWGDLEVEQIPQGFHATHSELNFWVRDAGDTLSGAIDYRTDLYDAERIRKLIGWLLQILTDAVASPDEPISQHSLLSPDEQAQLATWNRARPLDITDRSRIAQALEIPPSATLESEGGVWDRDILHARSLEVAQALLSAGVEEGDCVAVRMRRAPESVIALLGILRAGACWMPVPRAISNDSLNAWIEQTNGRALLHDSTVTGINLEVPARSLDFFAQDSSEESFQSPHRASSSRMAQLSGSAFSPPQSITFETLEVVLGSRESTQCLESSDLSLVLLAPDDPAFAPAALSALAHGATLAMPTEDCAADKLRLAAWIAHLKPTIIETDPPHLDAVLTTAGQQSVASIWIHGDLTQRLDIELPATSKGIWQIGGSRSTGHWGLLFPQTQNPSSGAPLAGGPAPGFETRILDPDGLELPPGLPGQLVLRQLGDVLPFNTPWRALWTHQGNLHITERQDALIWAQGQWLDILKLQTTLQALPFVTDAHIEARPSATGNSQLITWVAYRGDHEPTSTTLRKAVMNHLGDQLLGGIIVPLPEIPRDDRGAIRPRLLPDPSNTNVSAFEPPVSDMEKLLAAIWGKILDAERISAHDSFAELGGTSLQALRVIEEVESLTSWSLSPRLLFFQTLRQIAARAPQGGERP